MKIGDEVDEVLQGFLAFFKCHRGICDDSSKPFDLGNHALTLRTVPLRVIAVLIHWNIDVVPCGCLSDSGRSAHIDASTNVIFSNREATISRTSG
jgi:hypothetical protein